MARGIVNAAKSASNVISINQVGHIDRNKETELLCCALGADPLCALEIHSPVHRHLGAHSSPSRR
jgi:hypothetical protein